MFIKRIPAKPLSADDIKEVLALTDKDITSDKLKEYFAIFYGKSSARFRTNDTFTLKKGAFYNSTDVKTTIGRYIINMYCLPVPYLKKYGYYNGVWVNKSIDAIQDKMGDMILDDEMTTKEYANYMDRTEWISMNTAYYLVPSSDEATYMPLPDIIKKRDELFNQYKSELKNEDVSVGTKIENELLADADKEEKEIDDPTYDNFDSGIFKKDVAYKKGMIMIGTIQNPASGKYSIIKSNLTDGITPDEYDKVTALTLNGAYGRGVDTQRYGYESKKFNASLQNDIIGDTADDVEDGLADENVSDDISSNIDCGTKKYLNITITPDLASLFYYRFIIGDDGKLIELTPDNISKYVNKPLKMRSPMFCKGNSICQHCAGTLYQKIGIKNVGLISSNLTGNLLNMSLKKMHDSTVKVEYLNLDNFIIDH